MDNHVADKDTMSLCDFHSFWADPLMILLRSQLLKRMGNVWNFLIEPD